MYTSIFKMLLLSLAFSTRFGVIVSAASVVDADVTTIHKLLGASAGTASVSPVAARFKDTPSPVAADLPLPSDYCSTAVYHHNLHRLNHSAPLVTYDAETAAYAGQNIHNCSANPAEVVGSNYARFWGNGDNPWNNAQATVQAIEAWYEWEYLDYANTTNNYTADPDFDTFGNWGHFSQMVWQTETTIGCWSTSCGPETAFAKSLPSYPVADWSWAIVCASSAAGNLGGSGDFAANISPPLGQAPSNYGIMSNNAC